MSSTPQNITTSQRKTGDAAFSKTNAEQSSKRTSVALGSMSDETHAHAWTRFGARQDRAAARTAAAPRNYRSRSLRFIARRRCDAPAVGAGFVLSRLAHHSRTSGTTNMNLHEAKLSDL